MKLNRNNGSILHHRPEFASLPPEETQGKRDQGGWGVEETRGASDQGQHLISHPDHHGLSLSLSITSKHKLLVSMRANREHSESTVWNGDPGTISC